MSLALDTVVGRIQHRLASLKAFSLGKDLFANILWNAIGEGIAKSAVFIANIYLARTLGVDSYGILVLSQSAAMYIWLVVDLGTSTYGVREVARDSRCAGEVLNSLITMRFVLGCTIFLAYGTLLAHLFDRADPSRTAFLASGLYLVFYSLSPDWAVKGLQQFKLLTWGGGAFALAYLLGIAALVRGPDDVARAALAWSLAHLSGSLTLIAIARHLATGDGLTYRAGLPTYVNQVYSRLEEQLRERIRTYPYSSQSTCLIVEP
jgi:PST family polysaccharide transporter